MPTTGCYAPLVVSRRRILAASAFPALLGAGCGGGAKTLATVEAPTAGETAATSVPTVAPSPTPPPRPRGGIARLQSRRSLSFDTFDADLSGDASTVEVLGRTHSRLIDYTGFDAERFGPALASRWELPDPLTALFHIDPAARWHDRPPGNGDPVTPTDVAVSLSRTVGLSLSEPQPAARRAHDWRSVASVAVGPLASDTVRVSLLRPDPHIYHTLAGRFAFIQLPAAPELLARSPLEAASVVGSGPFVLRGQEDGELVFGAHSGGHAPPLLDGLRLAPAGDVVQRFLAGLEHRVVVEDRRDVAAIRAGAGSEAVRAPVLFDTPIMSTFYVGASPWNDPRLLEALHLAMDRVELATRLFGDPERGAATIFMLPPASGLSLGLNEPALQAFDGPVGLDARWRAARERWEAAGGAALGPITIDFPSIFDPRYAASAVVPALLNEALGVDQFRPAVLSYTTISRKAAEGEYGNGTAAFWFGWGPQFNDPAAARVLYETYHSAGPTARSLGFANDEVDSALQQLMLSARPDERAAPARQALSAIAANGFGGVIPWLVEVHDAFRWPLLTPGGPDGWWNQHLDVLAAVDSTSPRYRA